MLTALDEEMPEEAGTSQQDSRIFPVNNTTPEPDSHSLDTELPQPTMFTDIRLSNSAI